MPVQSMIGSRVCSGSMWECFGRSTIVKQVNINFWIKLSKLHPVAAKTPTNSLYFSQIANQPVSRYQHFFVISWFSFSLGASTAFSYNSRHHSVQIGGDKCPVSLPSWCAQPGCILSTLVCYLPICFSFFFLSSLSSVYYVHNKATDEQRINNQCLVSDELSAVTLFQPEALVKGEGYVCYLFSASSFHWPCLSRKPGIQHR